MTFDLPAAAEREYYQAIRFYGRRGHPLGLRFESDVEEAFQRIAATPTRWRLIGGGPARKYAVRVRFPSPIVYVVQPARIFVLAVAHDRRQQGYWRGRLEGEANA